MSRGIRVFYTAAADQLPAIGSGQQLGDYTVVKSDYLSSQPRAVDFSTVEGFKTNLVEDKFFQRLYKWNGTEWLLASNFDFTDETLIPNVTKIRKAHFDDIRNIIKTIQDNKLNKYGDFYFNAHDMTNAVLLWGRDSDLARIYFGNYWSDSQWLKFEFGDDRGAYTGDRIRFMYRSGVIYDPVMDIIGDQVHIFKYTVIDERLDVNGPINTTGDLTINGSVEIGSNLTVHGTATIDGETTIDDNLIVTGALDIGGMASMHDVLNVDLGITAGGSIETNEQLISNIITGTPPLVVASSTQCDNLNADLLDGEHLSDIIARIPTGVINFLPSPINIDFSSANYATAYTYTVDTALIPESASQLIFYVVSYNNWRVNDFGVKFRVDSNAPWYYLARSLDDDSRGVSAQQSMWPIKKPSNTFEWMKVGNGGIETFQIVGWM